MQLETVDEKGQPRITEGITRLVIRDPATGNPTAVFIEQYPGMVIGAKAGDLEFEETLRECGCLDSVVVENISQRLLEPKVL